MKKILLFVSVLAVSMTAMSQSFVSATDAAATKAESASVTADAQAAAAQAEAKPNYWKKGVDLSLTGSQSYVSKNSSWSTEWYNGGNSALSGLFTLKSWFNYEGPQGLMWDNLIDLKYGIGTNFSKDVAGRAWHLSDDKTAFSTTLGYNIGKGWHVAWNGDLTTTLFQNYSTISDNRSKMFYAVPLQPIRDMGVSTAMADALSSACFSPLRFTTGVGVDYKYSNEEKGIELSVYISPYTYKLVYVNDMRKFAAIKDDGDNVDGLYVTSISDIAGIGQNITDQAAYDAAIAKAQEAQKVADYVTFYQGMNEAANYVNPNKMKSFNLGSSFDVRYRQKFNDNIALSSRLQFYTNYIGIEVDWEIAAEFTLYKLLTAKISVNPRYDSTVAEKVENGKTLTGWDQAKLQLHELVSIGLAYRFEK